MKTDNFFSRMEFMFLVLLSVVQVTESQYVLLDVWLNSYSTQNPSEYAVRSYVDKNVLNSAKRGGKNFLRF